MFEFSIFLYHSIYELTPCLFVKWKGSSHCSLSQERMLLVVKDAERSIAILRSASLQLSIMTVFSQLSEE